MTLPPSATFSVIIPTYNRPDVLARTLQHLMQQDYPDDRYEIIVVDNSTDRTPDVVNELAAESPCPIRLIQTTERLPAVKRNMGLAASRFDYALFFNDDVWAEPQLIAEHARTHAAHDEPIAVLGHIDQSPEMPRNAFLDFWRPFAYFELAGKEDQAVSYLYFWSMNISLPRRAMQERNLLFHEDWAEIGEEDTELGYRWTRAGYRVFYNPRARGWHYHPMTLDSACGFVEGIGRGLRDLFDLVPDPYLPERFGIFSWRNRPRAIVRGLVRQALFNAVTVPHVRAWLNRKKENSKLSRWLYWKVLLFYMNRGYRVAPQRRPTPLVTLPPPSRAVEA